MTNEEAIQAIKCNWPDSRYTILREALYMAISALRQQDHFRDLTKKIEPLTNADRIRVMDDEEMADFLAYTWATSARAWQKDPGETLYWLQQPAGEEDKHESN